MELPPRAHRKGSARERRRRALRKRCGLLPPRPEPVGPCPLSHLGVKLPTEASQGLPQLVQRLPHYRLDRRPHRLGLQGKVAQQPCQGGIL